MAPVSTRTCPAAFPQMPHNAGALRRKGAGLTGCMQWRLRRLSHGRLTHRTRSVERAGLASSTPGQPSMAAMLVSWTLSVSRPGTMPNTIVATDRARTTNWRLRPGCSRAWPSRASPIHIDAATRR